MKRVGGLQAAAGEPGAPKLSPDGRRRPAARRRSAARPRKLRRAARRCCSRSCCRLSPGRRRAGAARPDGRRGRLFLARFFAEHRLSDPHPARARHLASLSRFISNLSLVAGGRRCAVRAPRRASPGECRPSLPRWVQLADSARFVPLEEVVAENLERLFPGMELLESHPFRVTRAAAAQATRSGRRPARGGAGGAAGAAVRLGGAARSGAGDAGVDARAARRRAGRRAGGRHEVRAAAGGTRPFQLAALPAAAAPCTVPEVASAGPSAARGRGPTRARPTSSR